MVHRKFLQKDEEIKMEVERRKLFEASFMMVSRTLRIAFIDSTYILFGIGNDATDATNATGAKRVSRREWIDLLTCP